MTHAAQAALRRTMEKESRTTRFCLVCNYVSRIIEPITSRCTKFRFKSLGDQQIIARLLLICEQEKVDVEENVYQALVDISGGDMRRAITMLQSCHRLKNGGSGLAVPLCREDIEEISGQVPLRFLDEFFEVCRNGDYAKLEAFVANMVFEAYSIGQMFDQLSERVIGHPELSNKQKCLIGDKLGESCMRLQEGGSEYLQIMDLGCVAIQALKA